MFLMHEEDEPTGKKGYSDPLKSRSFVADEITFFKGEPYEKHVLILHLLVRHHLWPLGKNNKVYNYWCQLKRSLSEQRAFDSLIVAHALLIRIYIVVVVI